MRQYKPLFKAPEQTEDIVVKFSVKMTLPQYWRLHEMAKYRNKDVSDLIHSLLNIENVSQIYERLKDISNDEIPSAGELPF